MSDLTPQPESSSLNDRDLLRRFLLDADEDAFAEIVRRHQGLVMGVCRRVIGSDADVDDAFQATFVTLARQPRSIRNATSLSSWLYTVAWRISWRLVKQRRKHPVEPLTKHPLHVPPDPLDQIASAQDCLVLDEELNDLPTKYREVLVMTYFADRSSQQIADELSVSKGTVDGRIRQARNMLRVRLARRGVAIGAMAMAAGLCKGATAAAAPAVMTSTILLGAQTLSGSLPGTTDLSHLEPLIRPETAMISSKLIVSGVLCVSAVVGAAGLGALATHDEGDGAAPSINAQSDDNPSDAEVSADASVNIAAATSQRRRRAGAASANAGMMTPEVAGMGMASGMEGGGIGDMDSFGGMAGAMGEMYGGGGFVAPKRTEHEQWLFQMLDKPVRNLDFPGDVPLAEILNAIATQFTETYVSGDSGKAVRQLKTYADPGLKVRGVNSLNNVTISDISFDGMTLRNALTLILAQTQNQSSAAVPLTFEIRDDVVMITAASAAGGDAVFKPYLDNAPPVEKWMHHMLDIPVRNLDFPGDVPLSEILDTIESYFTASFGDSNNGALKMAFYPDRGELNLEQITSLEDITISDIAFDGMTLRTALKHIFDQTVDDAKSPVPLTYVIHDEVMLVTTLSKSQSEDMMLTRIYPVGHLLGIPTAMPDTAGPIMGPPATGGGNGYFSLPAAQHQPVESQKPAQEELAIEQKPVLIPRPPLVQLVVDMTINADRDNWNQMAGGQGFVGNIDLFGENLVVRQTPDMHQQIVQLLNLLSAAVKTQ